SDWDAFAKELDHIVQYIRPVFVNYEHFVKIIKSVATKHIPRGFRKSNIPTWDKECIDLFEEFQISSEQSIADELIRTLNINRRKKLQTTTASLNFTHSSRTAWNLVKRLVAETSKTNLTDKVSSNDVATRLMRVVKIIMDKEQKTDIKKRLRSKKKEM
ncbi:Hypothetical protein CINCED_3A006061, partial [Cinara cedri]